MASIKFGNNRINLPANRIVRIGVGVGLVLLGLVGFLPILGFWMIPLGLIVLSVDIAIVRRWRRRFSVWAERWWRFYRRRPPLKNIRRALHQFRQLPLVKRWWPPAARVPRKGKRAAAPLPRIPEKA
jgi:hypothetical protein